MDHRLPQSCLNHRPSSSIYVFLLKISSPKNRKDHLHNLATFSCLLAAYLISLGRGILISMSQCHTSAFPIEQKHVSLVPISFSWRARSSPLLFLIYIQGLSEEHESQIHLLIIIESKDKYFQGSKSKSKSSASKD